MLWHMQLINFSKTVDLFGYQALSLLPQIVKERESSFMSLLWLVSLSKLLQIDYGRFKTYLLCGMFCSSCVSLC
jgi:hypothetical protein